MERAVSFSQLIREAREKERMSQRTMAKTIGISQAVLSGWENDKALPGGEFLQKIAEVLGIPLGTLEASWRSGEKGQHSSRLECSIGLGEDITQIILQLATQSESLHIIKGKDLAFLVRLQRMSGVTFSVQHAPYLHDCIDYLAKSGDR